MDRYTMKTRPIHKSITLYYPSCHPRCHGTRSIAKGTPGHRGFGPPPIKRARQFGSDSKPTRRRPGAEVQSFFLEREKAVASNRFCGVRSFLEPHNS